MRSLPHDDSRVREESAELYRASVAARIQELLDELWDDPEFFAEVKKRFEERSASGEFPALRDALSKIPEEEARDEFLVQRWFDAVKVLAPPRTQPWDALNTTIDSYREELYTGMAYLFRDVEFPEFAEEWLAELNRVGYRGMVPFRFHNTEVSRRYLRKRSQIGLTLRSRLTWGRVRMLSPWFPKALTKCFGFSLMAGGRSSAAIER